MEISEFGINVVLVEPGNYNTQFTQNRQRAFAVENSIYKSAFNKALQIIENDPPHLVVLDLLMPGISGLDVLQQVKARAPQLPVILLTGRGSTAEGAEGMQIGAYDYLMKPVNIDELIRKMEEAVKNKPSS